MNHIKCPLCTEDVSRQCFHKHFFSRKHLELWVKPQVLSADKNQLSAWRNSTKLSSCPSVTKGNKTYGMCFGCKKVKQSLPSFHLSDCPEAEKHIATLKEMIAPSEADPIKELEMLNKRFKKYKDENDELYGQISSEQEKNEALVKLIEEMCEGREDADKWLDEMNKITNG